jgi:4-amino-4-deoxy-L-arabinose transferase-like glycosyltransferase
MTQLGSSDLLFTFLFLLSMYFFLLAEKDERFYPVMGIAMGLACLTRYNGLPLFPLFLFLTFWKRPEHRGSALFWSGMVIGGLLFSLWLARNAITFGNPLYTEYSGELAAKAANPLAQLLSNSLYYLNPVHNIFVLLPFALWGLWKFGRTHSVLVFAMLAAWLLTAIWWVQAIRFAFPGYPILLIFSVLGALDLLKRFPRRAMLLGGSAIVLFLLFQGFLLCIYTYGSCNAVFDRSVGWFPKNIGLSSEGFYTWGLARDYVDGHALSGSYVAVESAPEADLWQRGVFRPDIRIAPAGVVQCPEYRISQQASGIGDVVFQTTDEPVTYVRLMSCR